jgi:hypothetical protein
MDLYFCIPDPGCRERCQKVLHRGDGNTVLLKRRPSVALQSILQNRWNLFVAGDEDQAVP